MSTKLSLAQAICKQFFTDDEPVSYEDAVGLLKTAYANSLRDGSTIPEKLGDITAQYLDDPVGSEQFNHDDLIQRAQTSGKTHVVGDVKAMLAEVKEFWGEQETPEVEAVKPALVAFPDETVELTQPDADPAAFEEYIGEAPVAESLTIAEEALLEEMAKADQIVADVETARTSEPGPLEAKALEIAAAENVVLEEETAPVELEEYECEYCKHSFEAKNPKVMLCPRCQQVYLLKVEMHGFQKASSLYAAYNGFARGAVHKADDLREAATTLGIKNAGDLKLVEVVHAIAHLVGLEWDIISAETAKASTPKETDEVLEAKAYVPSLPEGFTWPDMAKRCKQEIARVTRADDSPIEGLINYWQLRLAQSEAYEAEDWVGGKFFGEIADQLSEYREADRRKRAARLDIEKEAHGEEAPQPVILDAPTIEENGERLVKAALAAGVHDAFVGERNGEKVFQTPKNAVLEFYCLEDPSKRFRHNAYLTIRKWMQTTASSLTWKIKVVRTG